jgi:hypothetical protein
MDHVRHREHRYPLGHLFTLAYKPVEPLDDKLAGIYVGDIERDQRPGGIHATSMTCALPNIPVAVLPVSTHETN